MPQRDPDADPANRRRADLLLVERGLVPSRAQAQAAIAAGGVRADGVPVTRPAQMLALDVALEAEPAHPWVSRGGVKLAAALDAFAIDPAGLLCLDIGASTGGFTQVLLARGAVRVIAVDVGRDQLSAALRGDPRIDLREGFDARALTADSIGAPPDLVTADVSFISLTKVLPTVLPLAAAGARLVALVKPQFEVGRERIGKGGIVRDSADREAALRAVVAAVEALGWHVLGTMPSPIAGGDGNVEFLLGARRG
jgi:23S rRNA (cytidine1920-2'-O)/16S rRNA (cytidine1409-2'-O)-methyltransferase